MVITPDSKIKLIKNPLKLDNNNEMMFDSATAQYNYFTSLPKLEFDDLTYVRKDGVLRVETDSTLTYEDLLEYNFCMYQNTHFDSKWFYAFITEVNWINPGLTELKLETAYYQTWQFDLTFMDSFIEREHVNDDGIGKNTIEEGLSTGEYIINSRQLIKFFNKTNYLPVIGVTELIDANGNTGIPDVYEVHGRIMNGVRYISAENVTNISTLLRAYDALGKADAVQFMFMSPRELWGTHWSYTDVNFTKDGTTFTFRYYGLNSFDYVSGGNQDILRPTNLDGYYPKNRKMFNFPYCYLTLDSHDGNVQQFNFEDFEYPSLYDDSPSNRQIEIDYTGILTPGCSIKYIPMKYKKGTGYLYSFSAMKTPMCSWVSDPYINWLTQQAINTPFGTIDRKTGAGIASTLGVLAGAGLMATGHEYAGFKLLAGGFAGAFSNMQSDYQAQLQPNQAKGNVNSGDINFSLDLLNPEANVMSIKYDRAKSIDDFLSMYGYKVNRIGVPHLHVRTYYDYCKTNEANIEGNVPEEDLEQIRKMFNNGIRFWHDTSKYLDFSVNNSIIETPTPETTIINASITATGVNTNKRSYINLYGNTTQNGNPTPNNPIPIEVVTDDNIIEIANANYSQKNDYLVSLGDKSQYTRLDYIQTSGTQFLNTGVGGDCDTNIIFDIECVIPSLSGSNERAILGNKDSNNQGTTLFINSSNKLSTWSGSGTTWEIASLTANQTLNISVEYIKAGGRNATINGTSYTTSTANNSLNNGQNFGIFSDKVTSINSPSQIKLYHFKITKDDVVVRDLIPYKRNLDGAIGMLDTINNVFYLNQGTGVFSYVTEYSNKIELCKIGDYQDYIYKDNGTWYLHKEIGKVALDGSETGWSGTTFGNYYRYSYSISGIITGLSINDIELFSNYFYGDNGALNSSNAQIGMMAHYRQNDNVYFVSAETSVDNFKSWLSSHNTLLYYRLATPTDTEITDTTLINQLNSLYTARLYDGTTNITSITSNLQPYIQLHYNI